MNDTLKKVSFSALMFMMVFSLSFGSFFVPRAAALVGGDLVKGPNSDAVYYINGSTSTKHVFPDAKTYFTWYTNFDGIKTATVAELDMFPTGAPVSYRPGTLLVTHPNTAKVYAVEAGAKLHAIPDEATAAALYGAQWATWVRDVHELTFGNYTVGSDLTSSMHSEGTLLQKTGDSTIYMVEGGKIRPFASTAAFDANSLNYDYVVEVPSISGYTTGSSVTGAEAFATISGGGTGSVVPGGTVTVALSPNTPAANTVLLGGAARVPMLTVRFTAGANAVTVDSMTILRGGIASDTEFTDFDLLDGSTMLPLNNYSKSLNSSHQAVFNDDFTVPANGTMDVIVAANMVASLATLAGEYPAMGVTSIALKNNATMSGTLPITGNVMLTNGTITVGTATITTGANNPTATTKEVGTKDYVVSSINITNGSSATGQTLVMKSITFTNNGSASPEDVENVRLINANTGVTLATMAKVTADKISFTGLNLEILKGNNVNLDLKLDIKGGSLRTISYEIDKQADVVVYDNLRGFNVLPTYTGVTTSPYYNPADTTIGNGKLRIESISIQDTNIAENTNGVLLGKFKFVMDGEAGNISALGFRIATTTTGVQNATDVISDITNLTMKDPAGNTVAGPADPASNGLNNGFTATTTDTISVPIGETVYSVYGDLSADWTTNDVIQLRIFPEAITLKGDLTGNTITPSPSGAISSTALTIKAASLTLSLGSLSAQTVVAGTQDLELGRIVMDATNSGSDIRVTQLPINIVTVDGSAPSDVTGIQIFEGSTQIPVSSSSQTCSGTTCSTIVTNATTTLTISSGNLTIPKGTSKTVKIVGDLGTATTTGSFYFHLGSGSTTALDAQGQSATITYSGGNQASMTISSGGTLVISAAQDPAAAQLVGGTTVNVFQFDLQAKNEAMAINSVAFLIGAPDGGDAGDKDEVEELQLWESGGSSALGTLSVSANASTITPATPINLTLGQSKSFIVKAKVRDPHLASVATSGEGFDITMTNIDVDGQAVGSSSVTLSGNGAVSKSFHVYDSVPVVALGSITADQIISSAALVDLFKFSVAANSAGPVGLFKFTFGVSTSTSVILSTTGYSLYESSSSGTLGTVLSRSTDMVVTVNSASDGHIIATRFDVNDDNTANMSTVDNGEHLIINAAATRYFTLQGTLTAISSATANDDSISTVLAGDAAFAATAQENAGAIDGNDAEDDFIWSDLNFSTSYTAETATTIVGWFNGYRVSGLNNNSTTAQIQTD